MMEKTTTNMKLFHRDFSLMVAGQIVTVLGSSLLRFALSLYVLDLTGRADLFAVLYAASNVPLLLAPVGGAISDRFNRKVLMVLYDAVCCAVTLLFLIVLSAGKASVPAVGTLMVLLGVIGALETPNGTACLPLITNPDHLESANGIIQAVQALSSVVAPVLGGVLFGAAGIKTLVLVSSAAFAAAAFTETFIRIPYTRRERSGNMIRTIAADLKEGFVYVATDTFVRKLVSVAALLNLILVPCIVVGSPIILRMSMGSGDTMYGAGMGIIQAATIAGALLTGALTKKTKIPQMWRWVLLVSLLFLPAALAVTPPVLGLGYWPSFALYIGGMTVMAALTTVLSIYAIVLIQKRTPREHLGKVMAIIQAVAQCVAPLGQVAFGFAFEKSASRVSLPLLAACALMLGLTALTARMFRSHSETENAPAESV